MPPMAVAYITQRSWMLNLICKWCGYPRLGECVCGGGRPRGGDLALWRRPWRQPVPSAPMASLVPGTQEPCLQGLHWELLINRLKWSICTWVIWRGPQLTYCAFHLYEYEYVNLITLLEYYVGCLAWIWWLYLPGWAKFTASFIDHREQMYGST